MPNRIINYLARTDVFSLRESLYSFREIIIYTTRTLVFTHAQRARISTDHSLITHKKFSSCVHLGAIYNADESHYISSLSSLIISRRSKSGRCARRRYYFIQAHRQGVGQIIEKLFQLNHGPSPLLASAICLTLPAMMPE
jgi:hypothetical protein